MNPTRTLHDFGQSLWLDNITRDLLNNGTLQHYIDELSVSGLTSNPAIFNHAINNSTTYDVDISRQALPTKSAEDLFRSGPSRFDPRRRVVSTCFRADKWDRRLGVAGSLARLSS